VDSKLCPIPYEIMKKHRHVTVCIDIMFVNKIAFFMIISRHIKFGTAEFLTSKSAQTIKKAMNNVRKVYAKRGFHVRYCHADGEFEHMWAT